MQRDWWGEIDSEAPGTWAGRLEVRVLKADVNHITPENWSHRLGATHWRLYQHDAPGGLVANDSGARWELAAGRVYLIPSGLDLQSHCTMPFRQLYLHFDLLGFAVRSAQRELFPGPVAVPHEAHFEGAVAALADVIASQSGAARDTGCQNPARECWVRGVLCEALGRYLWSVPPENLERYRARVQELRPFWPALSQIEQRLDGVLSNRTLAALCSMSEDYFIRRFRSATGVPPAQYVLQRRIARAAELLLATEDSIEQIAERTGFCDRYYFTRAFTRTTGRAPAAFRRGEEN